MITQINTDIIELDVTAATPVTIKHGMGRQVAGWLVVWQDVSCDFVVQDPLADTAKELVLVPSATASVRLVLL